MDVSTLERSVLLLDVSTSQHRGLSWKWTCLDNSACAALVLVSTTDACAALGIALASPGLVFPTEYCAAPGWVSYKQGPKLNLVLSEQQ